jgi:hypothetical protein
MNEEEWKNNSTKVEGKNEICLAFPDVPEPIVRAISRPRFNAQNVSFALHLTFSPWRRRQQRHEAGCSEFACS